MKKYPVLNESDLCSHASMKLKLEELRTFQFLLHHSPELNATFHGKAEAIAYGLQPWIDALELAVKV